MGADMTFDVFAKTVYGKIALRKIGPVDENFRLYAVKWLHGERKAMEVIGANFRKALNGKNKGRLSILVKGTEKRVIVTSDEMDKEDGVN